MTDRLSWQWVLLPVWWLLTFFDIMLTIHAVGCGGFEMNGIASIIGLVNFLILKIIVMVIVSIYITRKSSRTYLSGIAAFSTLVIVLWNSGVVYLYENFGEWFWLSIAS